MRYKLAWLYPAVYSVLILVSIVTVLGLRFPSFTSPIFGIILLWFNQWLLTIPHELGHAVVARILGFKNVRIQIGYGRPIWSGQLLGFPWLVNRVPFGGATLLDQNSPTTRAKYILVVLAGPAVSIGFMIAVWTCFFTLKNPPNLSSFSGIFFWANAVVLLQTLIPSHYHDGSAAIANDGLLILQTLFPKIFFGPSASQRFIDITAKLLRFTGFLLAAAASFALAVLAILIFIKMAPRNPGLGPIVLGLLITVLSLLLGSMARRLLVEPFKLDTPPSNDEFLMQGYLEIAHRSSTQSDRSLAIFSPLFEHAAGGEKMRLIEEALQKYPDDIWLRYLHAWNLSDNGLFDEALHAIQIDETSFSWNERLTLTAMRIDILISANRSNDASVLCETWLSNTSPQTHKLEIIDALISYHLYREKLQNFDLLEQWALRGLTLDPNYDSLKGTLAGVHVEQGLFDEAHPVLLSRIESAPHQHQKAVALFYLSKIHAAQSRLSEAQNFLDQALILNDDLWLRSRAAKFASQTGLNVSVVS